MAHIPKHISNWITNCNDSFYRSLLSGFLGLSLALPASASRAPSAVGARPDSERILKARGLADQGKVDEAVKLLSDAIGGEKDKERRALMRMALAVIEYRAARDAQSTEHFNDAIADDTRIADYAHFHLGLLKKKAGQNKEARAEFEHMAGGRGTAKPTEIDARYQLALLHLSEKQWRPAITQLEFLRKNLRADERYPEIIYHLASAEMKSGRRALACKWARELYAKYPALPQISQGAQIWGPHLEKNSIDGQKIGCSASSKDLKTRVRRLWLAGDDVRAATELKDLKDATDDEGGSLVDTLIINNLIGDGKIDEALKLLLKRYDAEKGRVPYLLLLAKAASGAGEYQMAVAAYQRAFDLAPRGKNGPSALFQAAFTSYQMQDYDGASRRFEQLIHSRSGSKFARDAQWHLAWIRYLRGDYQGAYDSFTALSKAPSVRRVSRRKRHGQAVVLTSDSVARDRLQYWSAISLLKMGRAAEASTLLQSLARDPSIGYYAMLSYYRLLSLPGVKMPAEVDARLGLKRGDSGVGPSEEELKAAAAASADDVAADYAEEAGKDQAQEAADETTSDAAAETEAEAENDRNAVADVAGAAEEKATILKDASLAPKFERARDLALVGLEDGARRELRDIEKRVRSADDRRTLMSEYALVKNFERSSYLGEMGFGAARLRTGLRGESRLYWEFAYPRAWEPTVLQASRTTSVPEEMIWGIMRAESHYRSDVQSPVGALGLMQLMPFTGRKVAELLTANASTNSKTFETRSLLDPDTNIRLGSRYLQRLFEKFSGKVPLVAGAYNAGPHRVYAWVRNFGTLDMDEFIEHIPYIETRNYVKRVARNFQIYSLLYRGNAQSMKWLIQPVGVQVNEPQPSKEVW